MKRVICAILALVMIVSLCSCGKNAGTDEEEITAVGTLPVSFDDPAALSDAMTPVAFTADSLKFAEDGTATMDVDIYVQVMYDAVDVSKLKEGIRFFDAEGNEMQVESVKFKDDTVLINGGLDDGGVTLISIGGGVYMQALAEGYVAVFNCGTATYPVNAECVLIDNADPENQDVTVTLAEMADYLAADTITFNPNNTTLVIEGGEITQIVRNYLP